MSSPVILSNSSLTAQFALIILVTFDVYIHILPFFLFYFLNSGSVAKFVTNHMYTDFVSFQFLFKYYDLFLVNSKLLLVRPLLYNQLLHFQVC
jgi:hypothetical protein